MKINIQSILKELASFLESEAEQFIDQFDISDQDCCCMCCCC